MAHTCDCGQVCYCDGDDIFLELNTYGPEDFECSHECESEDVADFECPPCEDNGCALCLGDERAGASLDSEEISPRGDRKAISEALVAPLFPEVK